MRQSILLSIIALTLSSCAHKTLYERCSSGEEYLRYGSMDQCMAEKKTERSMLGAFAEGFSENYHPVTNSKGVTNCQTTGTNSDGLYSASTSCY